MARGLFKILNVVNDGGSPTQYTLTVDNSTGVAVGDHVGARLSNDAGAIYDVINVPNSTTIVIRDNLTEAETGEFGSPVIDTADTNSGYGTPEANFDLTQLPFDSSGWDAMLRRNTKLLDDNASIVDDLASTLVAGNTTSGSNIVLSMGDNILFAVDNSGSIGTPGANRPANMYLGTSLVIGTSAIDQDSFIASGDLSLTAGISNDLIFTARGSSITLNEAGNESLSPTNFTATSIVGALNELASTGGGGGGGETLAQTLSIGNSTGGTNIQVDETDQVLFGPDVGLTGDTPTSGTLLVTDGATGLGDLRVNRLLVGAGTLLIDQDSISPLGNDLTINGNTSISGYVNFGSATTADASGEFAAGDGTSTLTWEPTNGSGFADLKVEQNVGAGDLARFFADARNADSRAIFLARADTVSGGITMYSPSYAGGGPYPSAANTMVISSGGNSNITISTANGAATSGGRVKFGTAQVERWLIGSSTAAGEPAARVGAFMCASDGVHDIGADGDLRPRDVFINRALNVGDGITASNANGDIVAGDGTSELAYDASASIFSLVDNDAHTFDLSATTNTVFIAGEGNDHRVMTLASASAAGTNSAFSLAFKRSAGSLTTPATTAFGYALGSISMGGYDGTDWSGVGIIIRGEATEAWTNSAHGGRINFLTVANGSTTSVRRWTMEHNGHLLAGDEVGTQDNTYDIGFNGVNCRPRTLYLGTSLDVAGTVVISDDNITFNSDVGLSGDGATSGTLRVTDGASGLGDLRVNQLLVGNDTLIIDNNSIEIANLSDDLTFSARGASITLNEAGDESLSPTAFTATSIIGALNELAATGGGETLAETLAAGNTSGGTNMIISAGDTISSPGTGVAGDEVFGASASSSGGNSVVLGNSASSASTDTVAIGNTATVGNVRSISIGYSASCSNRDSVAIGNNVSQSGIASVCIGGASACTVNDAVVIGYAANSGASNSAVAIGGAVTGNASAVTIGHTATSSNSGVAIGYAADSGSTYGVAIGINATAGFNGVAIGRNSSITGNQSTGIGSSCSGTGQSSIAIGRLAAFSTFNESIVVGFNADATADNQLVIGSPEAPITTAYIGQGVSDTSPSTLVTLSATSSTGANAGSSFTISSGTSASGTDGDLTLQANSSDLTLSARDASITLNEAGNESLSTTAFVATSIIGALNELAGGSSATLATVLATGNTSGGTNMIISAGDTISSPGTGSAGDEVFGASASSTGGNSVVIGNGASSTNARIIAIGDSVTFTSSNAADCIGIGQNVTAGNNSNTCILIGNDVDTGDNSADNIIIGDTATLTSGTIRGVFIGNAATSTSSLADDAVCIGQGASLSASQSVVIGRNASKTGGGQGTIIGHNASSTAGTGAIAIGKTANSSHNYSICLGQDSDTTAANQFVVGGQSGALLSRAVTDVYFGLGVTVNTDTSSDGPVTIHTTSTTSGSGDAMDLILAPGTAAGSGDDGDLIFDVRGSSITFNSLTDLTLDANFTATTIVGAFNELKAGLALVTVEANTDTVTSPNVITTSESGKVFTNEGTTGENHHDLPAAEAGLRYTFICEDATGIQINPSSGDQIYLGQTASTVTGGNIESTTAMSAVTLVAINATTWVATEYTGVWTVN